MFPPGIPQELDENLQPVDNRSAFSKFWEKSNTPLTTKPGEMITAAGEKYFPEAKGDNWYLDTARGFYRGATGALGNIANSMTSPMGLATTALGAGEYAGIKAGLPAITNAVKWGNRVLGVPMMANAAQTIADTEKPLAERLFAVPELAGGAAMSMWRTKLGRKMFGDNTIPNNRPPIEVSSEPIPSGAKNVTPQMKMIGEGINGAPKSPPPPPPPNTPPPNPGETVQQYGKRMGFGATKAQHYYDYFDAEMAGSTPYQHAPEPTITPIEQSNPGFFDRMNRFAQDDSGHFDPDFWRKQEPENITTNASGDSMASQEALNRQSSMQNRGEQFGVYDRGGNFRPLIGPEAVDYTPKMGETYGVQGPEGFRVLEDKGGNYTQAKGSGIPQETIHQTPEVTPDTFEFTAPGETIDLSQFNDDWSQPPLTPEQQANINTDIAAEQASFPNPNNLPSPEEIQNQNIARNAYEQFKNSWADDPQMGREAMDEIMEGYKPGKALHDLQSGRNMNPERPIIGNPFGASRDLLTPELPAPSPEFAQQVLPPEFGPDRPFVDEPVHGGYARKFDEQVLGPENIFDEPQEMRVTTKPYEGNIAAGGADERVLDVLGSSLYSGDRPTIAIKELLQNAFDEHRITKQGNKPVKVAFDYSSKDADGNSSPSIIVRDSGRGLTPEELYTVFTDVGKTGKGNEADAAGGFGFAKAVPLLGGKYVKVESTVLENGRPVRYIFEGSPAELKKQTKGVNLHKVDVPPDAKTGLKVTTHFDENAYLGDAEKYVQDMTKYSKNISPVQFHENYGYGNPDKVNRWLNDEPVDPNEWNEQEWRDKLTTYASEPLPPKAGSITTPGAKVDFMFHPPGEGAEYSDYHLKTLNKGLYQNRTWGSYGSALPGVPNEIIVNVKALVEEGHSEYPFTANREQLNNNLRQEIDKWINENVKAGARKNKIASIQKMYDSIAPISHDSSISFLDEGGRLTPEELQELNSTSINNAMNTVQAITNSLTLMADDLKWSMQAGGKAKFPSERLKKVGLLFQSPKKGSTTLGIHIPSPSNADESAILINVMEHISSVLQHENQTSKLATKLFTTITHEIAHVPGGGHDTNFAYRHADLLSAIDSDETGSYLTWLKESFADASDPRRINSEILSFFDTYTKSRERSGNSSTDDILATGVHSTGRTNSGRGEESYGNGDGASGSSAGNSTRVRIPKNKISPKILKRMKEMGYEFRGQDEDTGDFLFEKTMAKGPKGPTLETEVGDQRPTERNAVGPSLNRKAGPVRESWNFARGLKASYDLSAMFRQAYGAISYRGWWQGAGKMLGAGWDEATFQGIQKGISEHPLFKKRIRGYNRSTGKPIVIPSFADDAGLQLGELSDALDKREEMIQSTWSETGGNIPYLSAAYRKTIGRGVRASNRAFTAMLNVARSQTFIDQVEAHNLLDPDTPNNLKRARDIAQAINTITGRGSLGKYLENHADLIGQGFWSPRLAASRLKMFNPWTYMNPNVSKEARQMYARSAISMLIAGTTMLKLAELCGAEINLDPSSADFMKAKLGKLRIDPWAGFQQYAVAASKLWTGKSTSTSPDKHGNTKTFDLTQPHNPYQPTRGSVVLNFLRGKSHPMVGALIDVFSGEDMIGNPVNIDEMTRMDSKNYILEQVAPLFLQDLKEIADEDKWLASYLMLPMMTGVGVQYYGERQPSIKNDRGWQ